MAGTAGGLLRQLFHRGAGVVLQRRFQHQVFGRIADDKEFGEQDDVRIRHLRAGGAGASQVPGDMSPITGFNWASAMR
jgi:hypothetical protein